MSTTIDSPPLHPSRTLHLALWVAQALLAAAFGTAGIMKLVLPISELAANLGWPGVVPPGLVRFIGAAELLGALGVILPTSTNILPRLTAVAAMGLFVIMALAIAFHVSRGEYGPVALNISLAILAVFVAVGRMKVMPVPPP